MDRYASHIFVGDFPELTGAVNRAVIGLEARGEQVAADAMVKAYDRLVGELGRLEIKAAAEGTKILRQKEESSRVRPDTGGGGGERLAAHLHCDPLGLTLAGSIGIANETQLDQEVSWWWTNETGSDVRVGGLVTGWFTDAGGGRSEPNQELFRQHPLFENVREVKAPAMLIKQPIAERRFVENSIDDIYAFWQARFLAIRAQFDNEVIAAFQLQAIP